MFAVGYSPCFLSALKLVGHKMAMDVADALVTAKAGIGARSEGGYGQVVDLVISLPSVSREDAERVAHAAHHTCSYSNATRNNIGVALTIA